MCDQMENIYKKYGNYRENNFSIVLKGIEGAEQIKQIMDKMRNNPPKEISGIKSIICWGYKHNYS